MNCTAVGAEIPDTIVIRRSFAAETVATLRAELLRTGSRMIEGGISLIHELILAACHRFAQCLETRVDAEKSGGRLCLKTQGFGYCLGG